MVDAERQVLALAAVNAAAAGVLGLLDRDAALGLCDQDRAGDDEDERADQEDDLADADLVAGRQALDRLDDELAGAPASMRQAEDDQRNAVAQAVLVDLLAEPHQEQTPGGEARDADDPEARRVVVDEALLHELHAGTGDVGMPII